MMRLFLLTLLFAFPAFACERPADYVSILERQPKALLFKVSGCGHPDRFLLGTYHSDSPKLQPVIDQLTPYLQASNRLWVEVVSGSEQMLKAQRLLMLPPESPPLKTLIGDALFAKTQELIAPVLRMDEATLQRFRPWALALLVQYPPAENDGVILDVRLQALAARNAIGISGLETIEQQFTVFTEMPEPMQIEFLKSTLEQFDQLAPMLKELETHYIAQDIWAIEALSEKQFNAMAENYPELAEYLRAKVIDARNIHMAQMILSRGDHTPFIAVGALHLPGEIGLFKALEVEGLQIVPIIE